MEDRLKIIHSKNGVNKILSGSHHFIEFGRKFNLSCGGILRLFCAAFLP